jgi:hypothetical protein
MRIRKNLLPERRMRRRFFNRLFISSLAGTDDFPPAAESAKVPLDTILEYF